MDIQIKHNSRMLFGSFGKAWRWYIRLDHTKHSYSKISIEFCNTLATDPSTISFCRFYSHVYDSAFIYSIFRECGERKVLEGKIWT